ncbi:DUF1661 domain-containing protein [Porphyromonas gulae]|uniref:DUF1661 domain-containing protein n=1 Tax=Porphyromonas gulae TaxID=111105 RepID=UPI003741F95C
MARDFFTSRATAKKISRRFSGKHAPQSERFRFVFYTPALAPSLFFSVVFSKLPVAMDPIYPISSQISIKKYVLITAFRVTLGH